MPPDKAKKINRSKALSLALAFLINAGISYWLIYPLWKKNNTLAREVNIKKQELSLKRGLKTQTLEAETQKLSAEVQDKLFSSAEEAFSRLNGIADYSTITIKSIAPGGNPEPKPNPKKEAPNTAQDNGISEIKINCQAEGDWQQLIGFLKNIENNGKTFIIDSLSTKGLEQNIWSNDSNLVLRTFILRQDKTGTK